MADPTTQRSDSDEYPTIGEHARKQGPSPAAPQGGRIAQVWRLLGPGLVTGASDNDPSGIGTYSVAGATTHYALLWLAIVTLPLLVAVQSMAARIGARRQEGLGSVIRERFGRTVLVICVAILVLANIVTIAADLGGVAAGIRLLVPIPALAVIPAVGLLLLAVEVFWSYRLFSRILKWLTMVLLLYVASGFVAHPDWGQVLAGSLIPHLSLSRDFLSALVAILGTTISPYMFFWIDSQETEEAKAQHTRDPGDRSASTESAEGARRTDIVVGMGYANLVFYFIILANAATLGKHHISIETASQAAVALTPIVGHFDTVIFAIGLIGAGLIAIPVLAGAMAYPLAELFHWREGLDRPLHRAPRFYGALSLAIVVGVALNFVGVNPMKALVYAAVLQGFLAPVLLVLLTIIARDERIMGESRNGWFDTVFGFAAAVVMALAAIALIVVTI